MHYVIFLIRHGMAPYRDIVEMNLPGSYLLEAGVMKAFGDGSVGWRVYDWVLLAVSSTSILSILRANGRLAGVLAASLFILIHGRDGVLMSGERDFAASVFMLCAVSLLFALSRKHFEGKSIVWMAFGFGALLSAVQTIKPTLLPMAGCLTGWMYWRARRDRANVRVFAVAFAGAIVPLLVVVAFVIKYSAGDALWGELHGLIPYHTSINPQAISFLINHSISPLIGLLVLWLIAAVCLGRTNDDAERSALLLCALCGLLSFVLQRKGFWYQRYPFIAFLLPLFVSDFSRLMRSSSRWRFVGFAGVIVGVVLATQCFIRLARFDHAEPEQYLLADLKRFGSAQSLSGHVQCIDTLGGCIDSLYAGQIVQSTGFLYDCYMLDGTNPVALGLRKRFWEAMERNPPNLIVVTDSVCYNIAPSFDKFGRWPEFSAYLANNYTLARTSGVQSPVMYWSRAMTPYAYRIYVRR